MEDFGDLNLQADGKLSSFEDLYASMDPDLGGNSTRPASTMSFNSWTFSPISEEVSCHDQSAEIHTSINQHPATVVQQPISNSVVNYAPQMQRNMSQCEYMYPNTITYHQQVNIHNFMSGYYMRPPAWKPEYPCTNVHNSGYLGQPPIQQSIYHADPLTTINTAELEFARCSTPEYMMALNSLHQTDSPLKHDHILAGNFSFESTPAGKMMSSFNQDSGYSSDIAASPIIHLQDGNIKLAHHKVTSTPQPPPVHRMTNMPLVKKENIAPTAPKLQNTRYTAPAVYNAHVALGNDGHVRQGMAAIKSQGTTDRVMGSLLQCDQKYSLDVKASSSELVQTKAEKDTARFTSMAEYQQAKKAKTADTKRKASSSSEYNRRRHNEPLNNHALDVMNEWYQTHSENPYPNKAQKEELSKRGGITIAQVKSWFANKRNRSNNTRPKKQKLEMEGRLMEICHQLARDAQKPEKDNAYYIQQLSSILHTAKH
ncbi:uncharacterized protein LOC127843832 [Dreissena polymorpha]|uniref:Homeobox domain-containing protein n=1 Tax=Dreissena polymorpha TaxID=45954 RepID=A0A9D4N413_DREPO|nr:uncharacterized protein LOC127843832 [Dreissena polymorpha]KAH3887410.1 hypothetical protein DPMN_011427 [Dreissena polymorpha]